MYMPKSRWTWAFFLVTLAQATICLALEAYVFGLFESSVLWSKLKDDDDTTQAKARAIPTYLAVFIFGFVYQIVLVWDALRLKNTIQVIGICLYNLGMMVYSAVQLDQVIDAVNSLAYGDNIDWDASDNIYIKPCLIAVPSILGLGTLLLSGISWKLYSEFAWTIYKHISADLRLKRRYLVYQIYIALLKFDFFFFLGFTVQFLVIAFDIKTYEMVLTGAALVITIPLLLLAAYCTRRESYAGQGCIIFLYFAGMAYFIFKLVRMYAPLQAYKYEAARHSFTAFAVLTILLLIATIITAIMCMMNFNKGLRPHIQKRKVPNADDPKYSNYGPSGRYGSPLQHRMDSVPSRMTID